MNLDAHDVVGGVLILVGILGVVVPLLPGTVLVAAGVLIWSLEEQSAAGWVVLGAALTLLGLGQVCRVLLPGRSLARAGIPRLSLFGGAVLGIVGFFVVPVVGLPLGFVLGVYLCEATRMDTHAAAWGSTKRAVKAVGASIAIEFVAALAAAGAWGVGLAVGG